MGWNVAFFPGNTVGYRMKGRLKDWESAEYPFSSFSHTLRANVRKENFMSALTIALFLLVRIVLPFSFLIVLGERVRQREASYWLKG
jgi:hypothetical protein